MNVPFYIARKLHGQGAERKKSVSRPAIIIATVGVALGLAIMIVSVCVVIGFKKEIQQKVVGFGSHIEVMNQRSIASTESFAIVADNNFVNGLRKIDGVGHVQRTSTKVGMLKTDEDFNGVQFKGVDADYDLTFISKNLIEGKMPKYGNESSKNNIVISKMMADELKLKTGDRVFAYFFEKTIKMRRFTVSGIYQTNMTQFDKSVVMTDKNTVNKLNSWSEDECSTIELTVNNFENLDAVDLKVLKQTNGITDRNGESYATFTIRELYPQVFNWLDLLDLNVWVILALMVCVAGFTMVSGLLILILERTSTIGVLKALGARNTTIRRVFLYFAMFIIGKGMIIGNIVGFGLALAQKQWNFIKLDATNYYVDSVPILFDPLILVLLNVATFVLSVLALVGPSFLISRIQPAKAIKFD